MGKKDKSKKGKGSEKSSAKSQKKLEKRLLKVEKCTEEQSIEEMLEEFQREQQKLTEVTCCSTGPPSPRSHFTFTAAVDTGELMLFGGEYFDGKKITMYSDVFLYNCKEESWTLVKSPNCPPPRSGHQAVYVKSTSIPASVWIFGGEYASPTQVRFYHYKDLWCFRMRTRKWELVRCEGSSMPCARSGHRMLFWKQSILLFGGFSDTGRKTVYFNDLWQLDLVALRWTQVKITGDVPLPRSACLLFGSADLKNVYLFGGYRKESVTKDLERGVICSDFFRLSLDKDGTTATCASLRPSGFRPKPARNAMSGIVYSANRALIFGGVHDVESEDGESVVGYFHNDLYTIELDKARWHLFNYASAKQSAHVEEKPEAEMPAPITEPCQIAQGAFTLTLNAQPVSANPSAAVTRSSNMPDCHAPPPPRSSAGLVILGSTLFLYGGVFEVGDRKVTLDDFFSLDLNQPVAWKCLFAGTQENQEWFGSDLEDDGDEDEDAEDVEHSNENKARRKEIRTPPGAVGGVGDMDVDEDDSSESDEDDEELVEDAPIPEAGETYTHYWTRTSEFWCSLVQRGLDEDANTQSKTADLDPAVLKLAERLSKDFHSNNRSKQ